MTTMNELSRNEMLSVFGCNKFEVEILESINKALAKKELPDFSNYNVYSTCECRTDVCHWDEAKIISRLKERGIWSKIEEILKGSEAAPNVTKARRDEKGNFKVEGYDGTFPYVAEYDNYRTMDMDAKLTLDIFKDGYVCHVKHNAAAEFVLMLPKGSEYIVLVD